MIRKLLTKDIKKFIKENPNSILIDVRSKDEWEIVGKPDGDKIKMLLSGFELIDINSFNEGKFPRKLYKVTLLKK